MKTYSECCSEVARRYDLGNNLVTGHRDKYWREAAMIFAEQFKEYSEGGRNMMRIIISMLIAKKESTEHAIKNGLANEIDFLTGRESAFKEIIDILERDLKMLENK